MSAEIKNHVLSIIDTIENGYKSEGPEYYDGQYEEGEIISGFDYLEGVLDIQYIVTGEGEYLGARVLLAYGGPNIWLDTQKQMVEGHWWGDSFSASYHSDIMDIDGALSELWGCR